MSLVLPLAEGRRSASAASPPCTYPDLPRPVRLAGSRRHMGALLTLLVALGAAPSLAQTSEGAGSTEGAGGLTEEEQREIEKALEADRAARAQAEQTTPAPTAQPAIPGAALLQSLNPDIALIADVAAAWFSADEPLQSGGHDPKGSGFHLQQLELSMGKAVDPYFRFDANIVFSQFGVEIEEAYATTLALPGRLQARVGQFLTRFGRFNPTHLHTWDFLDQPFIIGRYFGSEGNRGLGGELSYLLPLDWYAEVTLSVTDAAGEATARSFLGGGELALATPLDFQATGAVRQFFPFSDDLSLLVGLTGATGPNATGHRNRTDILGADVYLKYRPLSGGSFTVVSLQAELFYRRRQVPRDLLQDLGGYAYVLWRFDRRWEAAARYEYGSPSWDTRGEVGDPFLDPEWTDHRQRVSVSTTFRPTEFSRIRFQGAVDLPGWLPGPGWAAMVALEFSIGAHGAHQF